MPEKLLFLTSTRFWCLVIIAVLAVLGKEAIVSQDVVQALTTLLWGYVGVRTIDKFSLTAK